MILALRTDKPEAELYLYDKLGSKVDQYSWTGDRHLADTLLTSIQNLVKKHNAKLAELSGIIVFTGEGSFTGLRIGSTVANTLAYSYNIPIVNSEGKDWLKNGLENLKSAKPGNYVLPKYHSEPNITKPRLQPLAKPESEELS